MAIPPGVSGRDWQTALQQFTQAVGATWVFTSDDDIALYRDAYSPLWGEPEERLVSAAVAPDTAEQVSQIVRTANRFRIPLYPISTGKNLGYGGSAPNLSGSVVVDLKRMNRVIEVDDKRHFAIVEPGVAYFDLYRHIQDRGLKVWIDCPDPGGAARSGNALDHGVGYTFGAYRDHFHSHCGLEVVLPNGEIVRTGMGALPARRRGPSTATASARRSTGCSRRATSASSRRWASTCCPRPRRTRRASSRCRGARDIVPLVDIVNELEHAGAHRHAGLRQPAWRLRPAASGARRAAEAAGRPVRRRFRSLRAAAEPRLVELPAAVLRLAEGDRRAPGAREGPVHGGVPGATFQDGELLRFPLTQEQLDRVHKVAVGIPNMAIFSIGARTELNPSPSDGHLWFSPIIPENRRGGPRGAARLHGRVSRSWACRRWCRPSACPPPGCTAPSSSSWRFPISRTNVAQNQRTREAFRRWSRSPPSTAGASTARRRPSRTT